MARRKRFGVERCDEGGTLFDLDGNPIDHTWSVIDRSKTDGFGHYAEVSNHDRRSTARDEAARRNREESETKE